MARHLLLLGPEIDLHARIIGYYEIGIRHSVHFHSHGGAFVVLPVCQPEPLTSCHPLKEIMLPQHSGAVSSCSLGLRLSGCYLGIIASPLPPQCWPVMSSASVTQTQPLLSDLL